MVTSSTRRLPVVVVTGFLGAGKTTLLRHLLLHSGQRLAVLVNEFGDVGIDGELIASCGFCPEEEVAGRLVELTNGCLCCTVQDDFLPTMAQLLTRADQLDAIVVETSGLALPAPLVAAFGWPEIRSRTRVQAVVTVVDGEALANGHVVGDASAVEAQRQADPSLDHLTALEDLFADQLEAADLVLVSRSDRLEPAALERVQQLLVERLPASTTVLPLVRGALDPALLFPSASDDLVAASEPQGAHGSHDHDHGQEEGQGHDHGHGHDHRHDHDHHHEGGAHDHHPHDHRHAAMASLVIRREGCWSREQLETQLLTLLSQLPVVRLKGRLFQRGKRLPLQIQAVGRRLECWYEGQPGAVPQNRLELVVLVAQAHRDAVEQALASQLQPVPEPALQP